jgi:regulatory protein
MTARPSRPAGPPPTDATLRDAGLAYLARYAATEAALTRALGRVVDRWARRAMANGAMSGSAEADAVAAEAAQARALVRGVVTRLATAGAVSDSAFAESRTRSLVRGGRSRRAVAAHLAAKGVGTDTARAALEAEETDELTAALVLARRRRIGPFRVGDGDARDGERLRELAVMARAGFSQAVASEALRMPREAADEAVMRLRRG